MEPSTGRPGAAGRCRRPAFELVVEHLTWDWCVLRITTARHTVYRLRSADGIWEFLDAVKSGARDAELLAAADAPARRALRRVARAPRLRAGTWVGIEHEYRVLRDGELVDFARLLPDLALGGIQAEPTDGNAHHCRWGGLITADGVEAEVATPPWLLRPGGIDAAVESAALGRAYLEERLPPGVHLDGWSTHLNITIPDRGAVRLARRFCATVAPALILLLERPDSHGLLVRPRPSRLEIGGEFLDGDRLADALLFAAAGVLGLRHRPRAMRELSVHVALQPSRQRFGYHLARDAFGVDLHAEGRRALLRRRHGRSGAAGEQLLRCWTLTRDLIEPRAAATELRRLDEIVDGVEALPRSSAPAAVVA